jgi:uncharacterized phiE125 gp8 family phage protein
MWISAAREFWEEQTGRQLLTATWEYWLDAFPAHGSIELPHPPLQAVLSVKYDDSDGTEQVWDAANYRVIAPAGDRAPRGRLVLAAGGSWPTTLLQPAAVRIQYLAGYGDAPADVPELDQHVLMTLVGHFHKYGEAVQDAKNALSDLPMGAKMIIQGRRLASLPTLQPRYSWATTQIMDAVNAWPV